jgi:hypothetical protein
MLLSISFVSMFTPDEVCAFLTDPTSAAWGDSSEAMHRSRRRRARIQSSPLPAGTAMRIDASATRPVGLQIRIVHPGATNRSIGGSPQTALAAPRRRRRGASDELRTGRATGRRGLKVDGNAGGRPGNCRNLCTKRSSSRRRKVHSDWKENASRTTGRRFDVYRGTTCRPGSSPGPGCSRRLPAEQEGRLGGDKDHIVEAGQLDGSVPRRR